jgi:hypothetical protein
VLIRCLQDPWDIPTHPEDAGDLAELSYNTTSFLAKTESDALWSQAACVSESWHCGEVPHARQERMRARIAFFQGMYPTHSIRDEQLMSTLRLSPQALEERASTHTAATAPSSSSSAGGPDSYAVLFEQCVNESIWGVESFAMPSLFENSRPRSWTAGVGAFGRLDGLAGISRLRAPESNGIGDLVSALNAPLSAPAAASLGKEFFPSCDASSWCFSSSFLKKLFFFFPQKCAVQLSSSAKPWMRTS